MSPSLSLGVLDWSEISDEELTAVADEEDNVRTRIIFAREELKVWTGWDRNLDETSAYILRNKTMSRIARCWN